MIDFTVHTEIARPVSDVFAYATDPSKLPMWQTNTVSAVAENDGALTPARYPPPLRRGRPPAPASERARPG